MHSLISAQRLVLVPGLVGLLAVAWSKPAAAFTFAVGTQTDSHDRNIGDNKCEGDTTDKKCSLRAAIEEANEQIRLHGTVGLITVPNGTYKLSKGELVVNGGDITIQGASRTGTIVDAQGRSRVMSSAGDINEPFRLKKLTLRNGKLTDDSGGGLLLVSRQFQADDVLIHNNSAVDGGGVAAFDGSDLTFQHSTIRNNAASEFGGGMDLFGSSILMETSTVSTNTAPDGAGIESVDTMGTMTNCTLSGNVAIGGGGGLDVDGASEWAIIFSTISNNRANTSGGDNDFVGGGGVFYQLGAVRFSGSIVAGNTEGRASSHPHYRPDCAQSPAVSNIDSSNDNVVGVAGNCVGWVFNDKVGTAASPVNALLSGLNDNGGPAKTMALQNLSPAINRASHTGECPGTDERGIARPRGGICDSGSYEK